MERAFIRLEIRGSCDEVGAVERQHEQTEGCASFGWCLGQTMASTLRNMSDLLADSDKVLKDAADGFWDGIDDYLRTEGKRP
jgi:hypothetical protein